MPQKILNTPLRGDKVTILTQYLYGLKLTVNITKSNRENLKKYDGKRTFSPVRDLFVKRGYKVNAEVRDCDVTATKDDEFIIIELKKNLSVTLWHKV